MSRRSVLLLLASACACVCANSANLHTHAVPCDSHPGSVLCVGVSCVKHTQDAPPDVQAAPQLRNDTSGLTGPRPSSGPAAFSIPPCTVTGRRAVAARPAPTSARSLCPGLIQSAPGLLLQPAEPIVLTAQRAGEERMLRILVIGLLALGVSCQSLPGSGTCFDQGHITDVSGVDISFCSRSTLKPGTPLQITARYSGPPRSGKLRVARRATGAAVVLDQDAAGNVKARMTTGYATEGAHASP